MSEQEKKTQEEEKKVTTDETKAEETNTEETAAEEPKKKAVKAEKPGFARRAKSALKRNKKPIITGVIGFVSGAAATLGSVMFIGHKRQQHEMEQLRASEVQVLPEETLNPNE